MSSLHSLFSLCITSCGLVGFWSLERKQLSSHTRQMTCPCLKHDHIKCLGERNGWFMTPWWFTASSESLLCSSVRFLIDAAPCVEGKSSKFTGAVFTWLQVSSGASRLWGEIMTGGKARICLSLINPVLKQLKWSWADSLTQGWQSLSPKAGQGRPLLSPIWLLFTPAEALISSWCVQWLPLWLEQLEAGAVWAPRSWARQGRAPALQEHREAAGPSSCSSCQQRSSGLVSWSLAGTKYSSACTARRVLWAARGAVCLATSRRNLG